MINAIRQARRASALKRAGFIEVRPRIFQRGAAWYQLDSDGSLRYLPSTASAERRDAETRQEYRDDYKHFTC